MQKKGFIKNLMKTKKFAITAITQETIEMPCIASLI